MGRTQQVESEFGVREEEIPSIAGIGSWRAGKYSQEMVLKCADGAFSCIAAVNMRWHELVAAAIVCDGLAEGATALVVHDMDSGWTASGAKVGKEGLVRSNAVCIFFGCKRLDENCIAAMDGNHDVLVPTSCPGVEAAGVVSEDAGQWYVA